MYMVSLTLYHSSGFQAGDASEGLQYGRGASSLVSVLITDLNNAAVISKINCPWKVEFFAQ